MSKGFKFFIIAFILSLPIWWGIDVFQENLENFFYAQIGQPFEKMVLVQIPERVQKPKLDLEAKSAISLKINKASREKIGAHLWEGGGGVVVFQKNPEEILPIASLTKLMTAIIILENPQNYDFSQVLTISKKAADQGNVPNYGNLKEGEKFNLKQLLDLMLIYSSNDAAFALAEVIGLENFVQKMNQKAREIGLEKTYFVNPTGLDPENLYYHFLTQEYFNCSTAKDLVKLAQYILLNHPLIFEITLKKGPYPIENGISNLILPENQEIIGGKTGYTKEAKASLIFLFEDKRENVFINVILGLETEETRVIEMQKLIDWLNI